MAWLARAACGVMLASCMIGPRSGALPATVTPAFVQRTQVRWPEATRESLERGRSLFVSRCSKCHDLPDRLAYEEQQWPALIDKMALEAKIDAQQERLVLQFVLADRAAAIEPITASGARGTSRSHP